MMIYLNSLKLPNVGDEICSPAEDLDDIRIRRAYIERIEDNGDVFISRDGHTSKYRGLAALSLDENLPIEIGDLVLYYNSSTSHVGKVLNIDYPVCSLRLLGRSHDTTTTLDDVVYLTRPSNSFKSDKIKKNSRVRSLGYNNECVVDALYPWTNKAVLYDFTKDQYLPSAISDLTFIGSLLEAGDRVTLKEDKSSLRKVYHVGQVFYDNHSLTIYDDQGNVFLTDVSLVEKLKDPYSYL